MDKILDFIKEHSLPTTVVSDALQKTGAIPQIFPVTPAAKYVVGKIFYTMAVERSNWYVHHDLQQVPEGSVVFIECVNCENHAPIGELVSTYCFEHKKVAGIVVAGLVRDIFFLNRFPIWAKGITPLGCLNTKPADIPCASEFRWKEMKGIAVCDASGVVVIQESQLTETTYNNIVSAMEKEKSWFKSLSEGDSTFDIVCKGK